MERWSKIKHNLVGILKDKASMGKVLASSDNLKIHLALLRATTHDLSLPPPEEHIAKILSTAGYSTRITASVCIDVLMNRLHKTHNCGVALKCLLIIHRIIKHGRFILVDQLAVYPATGGRNYLNLSKFRDASTKESWDMSSWIRWYARVLEQLLLASRVLGYFFSHQGMPNRETVTALTNLDLLKETTALVGVVEEICRPPRHSEVSGNLLVVEVFRLVMDDNLAALKEISVRVKETLERFRCLSLGEAFEFSFVLRKVEACEPGLEELLSFPFVIDGDEAREMTESKGHVVGVARGLNEMLSATFAASSSLCNYGQGKLVTKGEKLSHSDGFLGHRSLKAVDSARYLSGSMNRFPVSEIAFTGQ